MSAKLQETATEIRKLIRSIQAGDATTEDQISDIVDVLDLIGDALENLHVAFADLAR